MSNSTFICILRSHFLIISWNTFDVKMRSNGFLFFASWHNHTSFTIACNQHMMWNVSNKIYFRVESLVSSATQTATHRCEIRTSHIVVECMKWHLHRLCLSLTLARRCFAIKHLIPIYRCRCCIYIEIFSVLSSAFFVFRFDARISLHVLLRLVVIRLSAERLWEKWFVCGGVWYASNPRHIFGI